MFSGKTTELLKQINRHRLAKKKCLIIKHKSDTRYLESAVNEVRTHEGVTYNKCDIVYYEKLTDDEYKYVLEYDVVGIEEGLFFENVSEFADSLANNGITVIVSSIDSSYCQQPFANITKLMTLSENIIKLTGICMDCCSNESSFTISKVQFDSKFLVGGIDCFKTVCRKCLIKHRQTKLD